MKIENSRIVFASGNTAHINAGIVGLSAEGRVGGGYDVTIWEDGTCTQWADTPTEQAIDVADMRELADHMIAEWARFRAAL